MINVAATKGMEGLSECMYCVLLVHKYLGTTRGRGRKYQFHQMSYICATLLVLKVVLKWIPNLNKTGYMLRAVLVWSLGPVPPLLNVLCWLYNLDRCDLRLMHIKMQVPVEADSIVSFFLFLFWVNVAWEPTPIPHSLVDTLVTSCCYHKVKWNSAA